MLLIAQKEERTADRRVFFYISDFPLVLQLEITIVLNMGLTFHVV
jgi:hypothetical protein